MSQLIENNQKSNINKKVLKYISPENILFLMHLRDVIKKDNYPFKRITIPKKIKPNERLLVLSPHPDDEILGLGGTLNFHLSARNDIMIVYMTDGSKADPNIKEEKMANLRKNEVELLAKEYNFKYKMLGFKDGCLEADDKSVSKIKNIIDDFKPTLIYLPSYIDSHKDHFKTNHIVYEALKNMKNKNIKIFGYEVWTNIPFPNYSIDITTYFDEKMKMLSFYKSQTKIINYEKLCNSRNSLNYTMYIDNVKEGYAESFIFFTAKDFVEIFKKLLTSIYENF
jgi:LmbE family N-acetylglucosaminyl deacetylase